MQRLSDTPLSEATEAMGQHTDDTAYQEIDSVPSATPTLAAARDTTPPAPSYTHVTRALTMRRIFAALDAPPTAEELRRIDAMRRLGITPLELALGVRRLDELLDADMDGAGGALAAAA